MFLHLVKEMLDIRKKELRPFETECGLFGVGQHTRSSDGYMHVYSLHPDACVCESVTMCLTYNYTVGEN